LIAAVFGLVYVIVNTGRLPDAWRVALVALGVAAFLAVVVRLARRRASAAPAADPSVPRRYGTVVLVEAVALFGGLMALNRLGVPSHAGVAWVSVVVGVHFFALAAVLRVPIMHLVGAAITTCGVAGWLLVALDATPSVVGVVSGVVPGAVLLAAAGWGARAEPGDADQPAGASADQADRHRTVGGRPTLRS
jgi:hypothetical protein